MSESATFLSRVYDCKYRFEHETGFVPTQLFLGPKEHHELKEYVAELERAGLLSPWTDQAEKNIRKYHNVLAGMTIIGLMSDGMRAGISST